MPSQISSPLQPGDGVVKGLESPAPQVLVAVIFIAFLIGVAWRWPTRRLRIVAIVGVVAILAVGWTIGRSDALGFRSGAFAVQPSRADTSGTSGMIVAANADGPFTLLLTLTNTSALPLDLLGLPDSVAVDAVSPYPPRFVGVGILDPKLFDSSSARPLKRVTVAPGEQIDLAFLGRAGPCATATGSSDSGYSLDRVKLAYEQLSLVHVQEVVLPEAVVVPAVFPCPPDSPAP